MDMMHSTSESDAKQLVHFFIAAGCMAALFWTLVLIAFFQWWYISTLSKLSRCQKVLEDIFMGPELVQPRQVSPISYISVPAHVQQQYPSHVTGAQNQMQ